MKKIQILMIAILMVTSGAFAFADMSVPASLQVALFYKIFDFDEGLSSITGEDIVIGIFYDPDNLQSKQAGEDIKENFSKLSDRKMNGKNIILKEITSLEQIRDINIIYVTPGNGPSIKAIVKKCETEKIVGISGVEEYAQEGLAVAIGLKNQKPNIIINKTGAELSGAKFCSKILALAQIL